VLGFSELVFSDLLRWAPTAKPSWLKVITTIPAHPGMLASIFFRFQEMLVRKGHTRWAWQLRYPCQLLTGFEFVPGATAGPGLYIPHPTASGIGKNCILGKNVTLGVGAACGGVMTLDDLEATNELFTYIGDDVILGARSFTMLGVTIGDRAVIGANSLVTKDVKPGAVVSGTPARFVAWRDGPPASEETASAGDAASSGG
jgi:serine O-acetyltransferase